MVMYSNKGEQWFKNPNNLYSKNYKDNHNSMTFKDHGTESGCEEFIYARYACKIELYLDDKNHPLFGEYVMMVDKKPFKVEYCPFCGIKL